MNLLDTQKVDLTVTPGNDAAGQPGVLPSDLTWSVDNSAIVSLSATTGTTVTAKGLTAGTANVSVASAEWATPATLTIDVQASTSTSGTITSGTPTAA